MSEEDTNEAQQLSAGGMEIPGDIEVPVGALSREPFRMVELTDGTAVKCVPVSPLLIQAIVERHALPEAPVKSIMPKGGVEETYVDDTDKGYLRAVREAEVAQREASTNALLLLGLPEVQPTEDTTWADELGFLGMKVSMEGTAGRLDYIKFRFLRNTYDLMLVIKTISQLSGATEKAIQQVMEDFA